MTTQGFYLRMFFISLLLAALGLTPAFQQTGGKSAAAPSAGLLPVSEAPVKSSGNQTPVGVSHTLNLQP